MNTEAPVSLVKGIGAKTEQMFHKMGVFTVGDILLHFPRDYVRFPEAKSLREAEDGEMAAVFMRIMSAPVVKRTRNMQVTVYRTETDGVPFEAVWFRMPYLKNSLKSGMQFVFYGKVQRRKNGLGMEQPKVFTPEQYQAMTGTLRPVYNLTQGLTNNLVSKSVEKILLDQNLLLEDYYTEDFRRENGLLPYRKALFDIHFPADMERLTEARKRLVFDEFFFFLLSMQFLKSHGEKAVNEFTFAEDSFLSNLGKRLPYELTGAQKRTIQEIEADMRSGHVMQRLIQGDVGSGKTIVAYLLMALCSHNQYQSAIMAPTEVLARQHYETFLEYGRMFGLEEIPVILLTGSMTAKQKKEAYEKMRTLDNAMIIGTHALIQEKAEFKELALVVTDEQHRFGVKQRETLAGKGKKPHILVMSATPIPRTLAIILYGDLDISLMDEVPKNRLPIKNCVVGTGYRKKAYEFIRGQIDAGHQAYIICPLVEDSEDIEAENVIDYTNRIRSIFPEKTQIAFLHGRMKAEEKNDLMERFLRNEIQILVSTTVIEVGVNVPNATVMMIENAERFGLAGLHQLRGRVGRGDAQSYCILVNGKNDKQKNKRLEILNHSNDGFEIASQDLKLRGPGDFFGIRQSGILDFKLADVYQDADILKKASEECMKLLKEDPNLELAEHEPLRRKLDADIARQAERINL